MSDENAQSLDPVPWVQVYTDNLPALGKFACKLTGCRHFAEDMVQDAFFRLASAPSLPSPNVLSLKDQLNYLFQIIRNLAIDHYRKQSLTSKHSAPDLGSDNLCINEISPEVICKDREMLEQLALLLSELPERTRYAFERHRIQGVPQKTIALELGVSPTLVNFMIKDALIHCSKLL